MFELTLDLLSTLTPCARAHALQIAYGHHWQGMYYVQIVVGGINMGQSVSWEAFTVM